MRHIYEYMQLLFLTNTAQPNQTESLKYKTEVYYEVQVVVHLWIIKFTSIYTYDHTKK